MNFSRAAAVAAAIALAATPAVGGEVRGTVRFSGPVPGAAAGNRPRAQAS